MNTPVLDFIKKYAAADISRLHMPGHKGKAYLGPEAWDLTEIKGADELYFADGIISESEMNASALFGTALTLYSTEGSSHGIRSMVAIAKMLYAGNSAKPVILAARNAHKAFLYAVAICDLNVQWIYPEDSDENSVAVCSISPDRLKQVLEQADEEGRLPFAVYITSPDYLGQCADIAALAAVSHSFGLPLLVDNAHGAYLHFLNGTHPVELGADICCDSAHKTLPVLTGGAYLHFRENVISAECAKAVMAMTGTSSPSYLIMASLDKCNAVLAAGFGDKLRKTAAELAAWKQKLIEMGVPVIESEALKAVICAAEMGFTGTELGDLLRKHNAEPEFCDADYLVLMVTPDTGKKDLDRAAAALTEALHERRRARKPVSLRLKAPECVMSIREAVFAPCEFIETDEAAGRICASPAVSCPPAIPVAVSGERISEESVGIMKACGIDRICVIKE